jgi:hypothetical protein
MWKKEMGKVKKKPRMVTKCCGSPTWSHAFNEVDKKGYDFCHACYQAEIDNLRPETKEEMAQRGLTLDETVSNIFNVLKNG